MAATGKAIRLQLRALDPSIGVGTRQALHLSLVGRPYSLGAARFKLQCPVASVQRGATGQQAERVKRCHNDPQELCFHSVCTGNAAKILQTSLLLAYVT